MNLRRLTRPSNLRGCRSIRCRTPALKQLLHCDAPETRDVVLFWRARLTFCLRATMLEPRVIWRRVGIGFQRFLIRTRFHTVRVMGGRKGAPRRRRALLPLNSQLRTCPDASANFRLCATLRHGSSVARPDETPETGHLSHGG